MNGRGRQWVRTCTSLLLATTMLISSLGYTPIVAGQEVTLDGPNVVRYQHPDTLANATRFILQGVRTADGGCLLTRTVTALTGQGRVVDREVAYDPDTCRSLIESGAPIGPDPFAVQQMEIQQGRVRTTSTGQTTTDQESGSVDEEAEPIAPGRYRASIRSYYIDPVPESAGGPIKVNEVFNQVEWSPAADCAVPSGTDMVVAYKYSWESRTGWLLLENSWTSSGGCSGASNRSTVHYNNKVFCASITGQPVGVFPTDTYYEPNSLTGLELLPNGNARVNYTWTARKAGGPCQLLLSFRSVRE